MEFPTHLSVNAYSGDPEQAGSTVGPKFKNWGIKSRIDPISRFADAPEPVDQRDWQRSDVGWGLVLPEREDFSPSDKALALDAPEPIQKLLAARPGSPVFRHIPGRFDFLRRYMEDGSLHDVLLTSANKRGIARTQLPWYLLICASPVEIPWRLQYILNQPCYVGRLDLDLEGLENYVKGLLSDWDDMDSRADQPLVWTVDHGANDITRLMRKAIADPVADKLKADTDFGNQVTRLAIEDATIAQLTNSLKEKQPALIVSTSHGMTGPLSDSELMLLQLGLLVDHHHLVLQPEPLLDQWSPNGAIWYAHACCSAGSDGASSYEGLLEPGSQLDNLLIGIAGLGSHTAPLPRKLLGHSKPLRAFIGHVEPTFDWTLRQPDTKAVLTDTISKALYNQLYQSNRVPVGMAFQACFDHVGELLALWEEAKRDLDTADEAAFETARYWALYHQLTAFDRRSMVILGDPTVCIPKTVAG